MTKSSTPKENGSEIFSDLPLNPEILRAVEDQGYRDMTPIQKQAIPLVLDGKDLIGIAQTGTGKTAAFSLPVLHLLSTQKAEYLPKTTRALILAPTRELAVQIAENVRNYAAHVPLRTTLVYGGASSKPQIKALQRGVDVVIATPGRLLDLFSDDHIRFGKIDYFVLDEADRMLDMGFIRDIRKIVSQLPKKRQTALFSATMSKEIEKLTTSILTNPFRIDIAPAATTAEKVDQHVLMVSKENKRPLLEHLLKDKDIRKVLIFTRTKHGANRLKTFLEKRKITTAAIHGNKAQNTRQKALDAFKAGEIRALVATDVAARGIDVDDVTHVINYDLPNEPDSYVHRIGRTARAGASGISLSFCAADEIAYLHGIEKIIRQKIPVMMEHPFHSDAPEAPPQKQIQRPPRQKNKPDSRRSPTKPGNSRRRSPNNRPKKKTD